MVPLPIPMLVLSVRFLLCHLHHNQYSFTTCCIPLSHVVMTCISLPHGLKSCIPLPHVVMTCSPYHMWLWNCPQPTHCFHQLADPERRIGFFECLRGSEDILVISECVQSLRKRIWNVSNSTFLEIHKNIFEKKL